MNEIEKIENRILLLEKIIYDKYDLSTKLIKYGKEKLNLSKEDIDDLNNFKIYLKKNIGDITYFRREFKFLCNFYKTECIYDDIKFDYTENAYQTAKIKNKEDRLKYQHSLPYNCKKIGNKIKIDIDEWNKNKVEIMSKCIKSKFDLNNLIMIKLLMTYGIELIEGNTWNDKFWGKEKLDKKIIDGKLGEGENMMGKILMNYRNKKLLEILNYI